MKTKCLYSLIARRGFNLLAVITCGVLIFSSSCKKEDSPIENKNELIGTWKCIGFGNTETETFRSIEPMDCDKCYKFSFQNDNVFGGQTYTNGVSWHYEIINDSIKFTHQFSTDVNELYDGDEFRNAIENTFAYQLNDSGALKLFYTGEDFNYLLFESR
jgi:hypothetical protein